MFIGQLSTSKMFSFTLAKTRLSKVIIAYIAYIFEYIKEKCWRGRITTNDKGQRLYKSCGL